MEKQDNKFIPPGNMLCFDKFDKWSGLKININKTYLTVFGFKTVEPPFVNELSLKWCNSFTLLGIVFDPELKEIGYNYEVGLGKLEEVANDWRHKYFKFLGKITVIKTFMFSRLSRIATILPTPSKTVSKRFKSYE